MMKTKFKKGDLVLDKKVGVKGLVKSVELRQSRDESDKTIYEFCKVFFMGQTKCWWVEKRYLKLLSRE